MTSNMDDRTECNKGLHADELDDLFGKIILFQSFSLSTILFWIAILSLFSGIYLAFSFWYSTPLYEGLYGLGNLASILALVLGFLLFLTFAVAGRALMYLRHIAVRA